MVEYRHSNPGIATARGSACRILDARRPSYGTYWSLVSWACGARQYSRCRLPKSDRTPPTPIHHPAPPQTPHGGEGLFLLLHCAARSQPDGEIEHAYCCLIPTSGRAKHVLVVTVSQTLRSKGVVCTCNSNPAFFTGNRDVRSCISQEQRPEFDIGTLQHRDPSRQFEQSSSWTQLDANFKEGRCRYGPRYGHSSVCPNMQRRLSAMI